MADDVPWHYLRQNDSTRYPRRVVCIDAEAKVRERKTGETHTMRLACASFDVVPAGGGEPERTERTTAWSPAELWEWIDARTRSKTRTVVWAHNLGYDLRVTDGIAQLARLGWERAFLAIDGVRTCARYRKGSRTLALVDSASYLPTQLADIAGRVGHAKLPIPSMDDSADAWEAYCRQDAEILRAAVLYLLGWLESNDCGMFRLTGPAQAMGCFRHRFLQAGMMLCHRDEDALAAERAAAWAGRCEAFRHGEVAGPLYEWDFTLAYLTLARRLWLPVQLHSESRQRSVRRLLASQGRFRVLAEVEVECSEPVLPAAGEHGIVWPVGRFVTTAWDLELEAALARGAKLRARRAWLYRKRPALSSWAEWLLALLAPDGLPSACLERVMLKAWARSLIGRFGMRVPVWEEIGELDKPSLRYVPAIDADTGEEGAILELDRLWFERSGFQDANDAMPAVLSYVMAAARVRLLEAIERAGAEHVVYCDTDSVIVDAEGHRRMSRGRMPASLEGLRLKGEHARALILGPRQVVLGDELRVAGLPRKAVRRSETEFEAELWESLSSTLGRGKTAEVRVQRRTIRLRGTDHRRVHLEDGRTEPIRLSMPANGADRLLDPPIRTWQPPVGAAR